MQALRMYVLSVKALCLIGAKMRSRKHDVCENYEKKKTSVIWQLDSSWFLQHYQYHFFSNMGAKKLIFADIKHIA